MSRYNIIYKSPAQIQQSYLCECHTICRFEYLDIDILRKAQAPHLFQGGNSLLMIFKLYPAIACYQSIHVRHQNKLIVSVTQTRQSML